MLQSGAGSAVQRLPRVSHGVGSQAGVRTEASWELVEGIRGGEALDKEWNE